MIHYARNILAKVPAAAQTEIKKAFWELLDTDAIDLDPARSWWPPCRPASTPSPSYRAQYPAAVRCLLTDRDQLTSYLRFPVEHCGCRFRIMV